MCSRRYARIDILDGFVSDKRRTVYYTSMPIIKEDELLCQNPYADCY